MNSQKIIMRNNNWILNCQRRFDYYEKRKDFEKELKLLNDDKNKEKDELIKIVSADGPCFSSK